MEEEITRKGAGLGDIRAGGGRKGKRGKGLTPLETKRIEGDENRRRKKVIMNGYKITQKELK